MTVHIDDRTAPAFPTGWSPAMDPVYEGELEIWLLVEDG